MYFYVFVKIQKHPLKTDVRSHVFDRFGLISKPATYVLGLWEE